MSDLGIYWHFQALASTNGLIQEAVRRGLRESAAYIGLRYAATVPSSRVGRLVTTDVRPPRAYVGVRKSGVGYKANFFEVGTRPHVIIPKARKLITIGRGRLRTSVHQPGWRSAHLAIPMNGTMIFRNAVHHPGMAGGAYLRRAAEDSVGVVGRLMTRAFREVLK